MVVFEHPLLVLLAVIFSVLLAWFVYRNDERFLAATSPMKALLVSLRFLSILILSLLLLKPKWLQQTKEVEKPIVVFLQDASSSIMNYTDSSYYASVFFDDIQTNNEELNKDYEVFTYHFDQNLHEGIQKNYSGTSTDIAKALQQVDDQFYNRNLAAIVLASDGNFNKGMNPFYKASELNCPIFTLAMGDTSIEKDVRIESIRHNEIAYFENKFPVQFTLVSNFNSKKDFKISVRNKNKIIHEERVNLESNIPLSKELYIEANEEGVQFYDIVISSFDGEKNIENNKRQIAIEVLENSQNILILSSNPHPDVAALKQALQEGLNYNVKTALFNSFTDEIEAYNLIILHQIPDFKNNPNELLSRIISSETSVFFVGGIKTNWFEFNKIQDLIKVNSAGQKQEVFASINDDFNSFSLSEKCQDFIDIAPPLTAPFADIITKAPRQSLLTQKINSIETNKDLLVLHEFNEKQVAVLFAEGIWKWRLFDFQINQSHENFNELFQSISQYLTLNKDKRKLRLQYEKIITEGENFEIEAQFYNENYQLIPNAKVQMELYDKEGVDYTYSLLASGTKYKAKVKDLREGSYNFNISAEYKDLKKHQKGTFTVLESKLESEDQTANWELLHQLSELSNGMLLNKNSFGNYADTIVKNTEQKNNIYFQEYLTELIKQKGIFLVILLSLSIEWVLRRRLGTH